MFCDQSIAHGLHVLANIGRHTPPPSLSSRLAEFYEKPCTVDLLGSGQFSKS
jgi:hypothetical protein